MSAAELISFGTSMMAWENHVYQVAWFHKENVAQLTTVREIQQYDYKVGWPDAA